jgi:hypothetical protein
VKITAIRAVLTMLIYKLSNTLKMISYNIFLNKTPFIEKKQLNFKINHFLWFFCSNSGTCA